MNPLEWVVGDFRVAPDRALLAAEVTELMPPVIAQRKDPSMVKFDVPRLLEAQFFAGSGEELLYVIIAHRSD